MEAEDLPAFGVARHALSSGARPRAPTRRGRTLTRAEATRRGTESASTATRRGGDASRARIRATTIRLVAPTVARRATAPASRRRAHSDATYARRPPRSRAASRTVDIGPSRHSAGARAGLPHRRAVGRVREQAVPPMAGMCRARWLRRGLGVSPAREFRQPGSSPSPVVSLAARNVAAAASPDAKLFSASQPPSTVSAMPLTYAD